MAGTCYSESVKMGHGTVIRSASYGGTYDTAQKDSNTGRTKMNSPGRRKLYHENLRLSLEKGTFAAIARVKRPTENRVDFIREAITREIHRREALLAERSGGEA